MCLLMVLLFYPSMGVSEDRHENTNVVLDAQIIAAGKALSDIEPPAVVFMGELHDQYAYHLNQLAVISALRERGLKVAIGMEMMQTPFQPFLDDYIGGAIDFVTMLRGTEYFARWKYDPRLYQPIFEYAQRYRLPLLALNAPRELTDRVSAVGISGLDEDERQQLPATLTPLDPEYRMVLEQVFEEHEEFGDMDLERFIDVQTTWDEVMGYHISQFVQDNPEHILVVLAGTQHVAHGYGIPARIEKHAGLRSLIILSENERAEHPEAADVFLDLTGEDLPANGRMGVLIDTSVSGAVVSGFAEDSPAKKAGVQPGDIIVAVDDQVVQRFEDIRLALWDKRPGEKVLLEVRRETDVEMQMSFQLN